MKTGEYHFNPTYFRTTICRSRIFLKKSRKIGPSFKEFSIYKQRKNSNFITFVESRLKILASRQGRLVSIKYSLANGGITLSYTKQLNV